MRQLIIILTIVATAGAYGQNIASDNISWTVDNLLDSASNATMPFASEFKVYPNQQKIDWVQGNGGYVSTFTITASSVQWTDIAQQGVVEYEVTFQGKSGQFRIERGADFFHIKLFVMEGNKNILPFTFHISNYSAL